MAQDLHTFRTVKPPVVAHPATHCGIYEPGQFLQTLIVARGGHPPLADGDPNRFGGFGAHRRKKAHKILSPTILRSPRLEGVPKKIELNRFRVPRPIIILAINDAGLGFMKFQTALQESIMDGFQYRTSLPLTSAMDDGTVRITLELDRPILPPHPEIKRIMQEEIGQQRTDDSALRRASCPLLQSAICLLHGSTKPPRNIQPQPWAVGVVCHSTLNQVMWNGIKERFDVQINDPVSIPAALSRHPHSVECRLPGPIAVRVRMELRFHQRLQHHLHHGLCDAIADSWNAKRALAAVILRYLHEPHRRRKIRTRRHPIPDLIKVVLQVLLECRQRLAIHTGNTSVCLHPLVRFPNELLRNYIRLCFRHEFLPLLVDPYPRPDRRVPSLHPRYWVSSLQRTRPPLRLASVRSSSWVLHLDFSL